MEDQQQVEIVQDKLLPKNGRYLIGKAGYAQLEIHECTEIKYQYVQLGGNNRGFRLLITSETGQYIVHCFGSQGKFPELIQADSCIE